MDFALLEVDGGTRRRVDTFVQTAGERPPRSMGFFGTKAIYLGQTSSSSLLARVI